jgi:hypothetical protein
MSSRQDHAAPVCSQRGTRTDSGEPAPRSGITRARSGAPGRPATGPVSPFCSEQSAASSMPPDQFTRSPQLREGWTSANLLKKPSNMMSRPSI